MGKIKTLAALKKIVNKLKKQNKHIVFTNGCFDILHPGHIKVLKEAKENGDILIVGLNSDSSIRKIKGKQGRPILDEKARMQILEAIEVVSYIVLFHELTPYNLIKAIRPDCLVKGEDWGKNKIVGSNLVDIIHRVKIYPKYSTSRIIDKIKHA